MAKLTEFTNPISGAKGNLFSLSGWWSNIVGVVVILLTVAIGQNVLKTVGRKVPALDTQIDPFVTQPNIGSPSRERY